MKKIALALSVLALVIPLRATADGEPRTGYIGSHGQYQATGPGHFVAAVAAPFTIQASNDGGFTWHVLAYETEPGPYSGALETENGELVEVDVQCVNCGCNEIMSPCDFQRPGIVAAFNDSPEAP
ncbi:MAG: hypothetical protein ABR548_08665 [Actinomycetota bacterium]|nr:hypothetical protein [Actinomycetota bacterium]